MTKSQALDLLNTHTQNQNLRRHMLAVGATMRALADRLGGDPELWEILGLIHDADWEKTKDDISAHTKLTLQWLDEIGETQSELIHALQSHNTRHTSLAEIENTMEWALECCDELTGFIVACTLVSPTKKLADVTPESVLKKFPQKAFAAAVDRAQISQCETKLNIPLPEFVSITLSAMQSIAPSIGL